MASDMPNDMLAEWQTLRGEIERRSTVQQALFVLNLTAVTALAAIAAKTGTRREAGALLLLLPFVTYSLARLWIDHHQSILGIGRYIRETMEPESNLNWETYHEAKGVERRADRWNLDFFTAQAVVFVTPALAAVIAGLTLSRPWADTDASSISIWILVVVAIAALCLNAWGWTRLIWPPAAEPTRDPAVTR